MSALDHQFTALSDPTRRAIIARLAKGDATVSQLVDQFKLTQPTISSHIKMLEKSGLISRSRVAQTRPCRLNPQGLKMVADWIADYEHFWTATIDRFVEVAEKSKQKDQS